MMPASLLKAQNHISTTSAATNMGTLTYDDDHQYDFSTRSSSQQHISTPRHHCVATLSGHSSYLSSLALAGDFLYTGSSDREIRSWRLIEFEVQTNDHHSVVVVAAGKGAVKALVVLPDKVLFSAHQDHKIRVWKIDNHGEANNHHHQRHTRIATLPTFADRALTVLVPRNHVQIRRHKSSTWVHHVDTVSALALSMDNTLLYSVSWDRTLKIWRTSDFKCLQSVWNAHDDAINAVAVSRDGSVYTGSADKKIKVWKKMMQGDKKHCLVDTLRHKSGINALAVSTNGRMLFSGACDRSILVWEKADNAEKMVVVGALRGHTKSILCLVVVSDHDGGLVCSGSADKTVRIWRCVNRSTFSCLSILEGHTGPVKCLAVSASQANQGDEWSSYNVYSGSLDCDIKVWKIFVV